MAKPRVLCVVGTRPDAIKTAPVVVELRKHADVVETVLISTGQHREMLSQALAAFDLAPDEDLDVMQHGQSLAEMTSRVLMGLDGALQRWAPQMVLAQGDTTSTFCAALAAFYHQTPFGHIEAGLRTYDLTHPFPEEFNRRAAAVVARLNFAPTPRAADHLAAEGVDPGTVFVTGNTGTDAVLQLAERGGREWFSEHGGKVALVTTHRRENWGEPQREIARACRTLLERFEDLLVVVPLHANPTVREVLIGELGSCHRARLIEPPDYADFVALMRRCDLILTDSGGVQEEAPAFGRPVLVLRQTTERPEGIEAGCARLVGTDHDRIVDEASRLLGDPAAYEAMSRVASPYGDGRASRRIRYLVLRALGVETDEEAMWI
jgi:UDP-N-acetylglucosamine 2-epimerase